MSKQDEARKRAAVKKARKAGDRRNNGAAIEAGLQEELVEDNVPGEPAEASGGPRSHEEDTPLGTMAAAFRRSGHYPAKK